jgi:Tol biopolymer transport system component
MGGGDPETSLTGPARASFAVPRSIRAFRGGVSPDGQTLLIGANRRNPDGSEDPVSRIYRRAINDYEVTPVPGTDRVQQGVVSADGKWMAVITPVSEQSTQRQLVRLPIDGSSPPVKIATAGDNWNVLTWLENGDFLISLSSLTTFVRLPRGSETPGPEIPFDLGGRSAGAAFGLPLPGDRGVFVSVDIYHAQGWSREAWVLDLKTDKMHRLVENAGSIAYSPTGHIVFARGDTLMAAPFDLDRLALTGDVTALSRDLRIAAAWEHGEFTLSKNGTLVFMPGGLVGVDRRLISVDAAGTVTPFGSERRTFEQFPAVSRDGGRVAVVLANDRGNWEIWTADQNRPVLTRTVSLPNADAAVPIWAPGGQRLAFTRFSQDKDDGVYVQNADGSGTPRLVMRTDGPGVFVTASSWERDGAGLLVMKVDGAKNSIHRVAVAAEGQLSAPRALRTTSYMDLNATLSPDGRFIAFESNESGKFEIYVALWSADGLAGRPLMVSSGGSASLLGPGGVGIGWAGDSRRLFFGTPEQKVMSVMVDASPTLTASRPVVVHDLKKLRASGWNVLPNGGLLAIQRSEAEDDTSTFSVVFNWFDELRARMGNR